MLYLRAATQLFGSMHFNNPAVMLAVVDHFGADTIDRALEIHGIDDFGTTITKFIKTLPALKAYVERVSRRMINADLVCFYLEQGYWDSEQMAIYLFKEKLVRLDVKDQKGNNWLHIACKTVDLQLVEYLLECGVDWTERNNYGVYALDLLRNPIYISNHASHRFYTPELVEKIGKAVEKLQAYKKSVQERIQLENEIECTTLGGQPVINRRKRL